MSHLHDEYNILGGDPDAIRGQVRELGLVASRMKSAAARLREISLEGVWESDAGRSFGRDIGTTPTTLDAVADRLQDAADAMRPYWTQLKDSQQAMKGYDRDAALAEATMKAKDEALKGLAPDDPQRPSLVSERRQAVMDLQTAERGFAREGKSAYDDEQRVAAKLCDIDAPMTDDGWYDTVEGLEGAGRQASLFGIVAKPVALAGGAEPLAKGIRKAAYDEGSWSDVRDSGLWYASDYVTLGVGRAAKTVKEAKLAKASRRLNHLPGKPPRINDNPIAAPPGRGLGKQGRYRGMTALKDQSGYSDLTKAFDEWEQVAGEGRVAKASVVIEYSATSANRVARRVRTGVKTAGSTGLDKDEAARRRQEEADEEGKRTTARRFAEGLPEDPRERGMR